uniref:Uncharacterized protein n=1 Tax=Anguilla anguilla TaxID=7936 RepID=A0A0E9PEI3_ANGAN
MLVISFFVIYRLFFRFILD